MAVSTLTSLDKILKDFYQGPIRDQLNNEMLVFELFNKKKVSWTGRKAIMPVRIGRNESAGFRAEDNDLPTADRQKYADLTIQAKYLYGRMDITGPTIEQAKANAGAFVNALQSELDGAIESVKNQGDPSCFIGGGNVGFVFDRSAAAATMPLSGNLEGLPLAAATPVPCILVRTDTYEEITTGGAGALHVRQSVTPGAVDFTTAAAAPNTVDLTGLAKGAAATVVVATDPLSTPAYVTTDEAMGIYGNLGGGYIDLAGGTVSFHGNLRDTASLEPLRSTIESVENTIASSNPGAGAVTALATKRMQAMLDSIALKAGGSAPDCMIANHIFRQEYTALMSFTSVTDNATSLSKSVDGGDAGFNMGSLSFNGIPLKVARHCGKGLLIFLSLKSWSIAQITEIGLADLDGSVLSRVANRDAYEAFVRYYYNVVCERPNRNGILVGISYAGV